MKVRFRSFLDRSKSLGLITVANLSKFIKSNKQNVIYFINQPVILTITLV